MLPVLIIASYIYRDYCIFSYVFIGISILIIFFSLLFPRVVSDSSSDSFTIVSISPNDFFHESALSYTLPLLSFVFGLGPLFFVILVLLVCLFMYISDSLIPNPILRLMGYHYYSIDLENGIQGYLLISKHTLSDARYTSSGKLISNYIIMDSDV